MPAAKKEPSVNQDSFAPHKSAPVNASMTDLKIDFKRYRKVRRFFAKVFIHFIWWDFFLNRPILRLFRSSPIGRWQKIASQFRVLANEMGGVLIKLGQFLSIRVDILPAEVISELAELQDDVPPVSVEEIIGQIEKDFGRPISRKFKWISNEPLGSASLAQAHLVVLSTGSEAVVKVLRPGIDVIVETDLTAIALGFKWLKYIKVIRQRVDMDWLIKEFTTITRNELNFDAEAKNARRFAKDFHKDDRVYIPNVFWDYCGQRTLTMENVGYIKISDFSTISAVGINRAKVADTLYEVFMKQFFETHFVHVDPHPGNVFIKPLPTDKEIEAGQVHFSTYDKVPHQPDRPFQIIFVDFGMMSDVPERLRAALREYAIGIGTRDSHKLVQSFVSLGMINDEVDLKRLEEAQEAIFKRFWGVPMGQMKDLAYSEAKNFYNEFRDIIYEAPFQFQADLLFVMRAVGILSGMATKLDPDFDPWSKTIPMAERFAQDELKNAWKNLFDKASDIEHLVLGLPNQINKLFSQLERGKLTTQTSFSKDAQKVIGRLEKAIHRLAYFFLSTGIFVSGIYLYSIQPDALLPKILILSGGIIALLGLFEK